MMVVYITFLAFILAFYQFAKQITFFRLNNTFLKKNRLCLVLITLGFIPVLEMIAKTYGMHLSHYASGIMLEILEQVKNTIEIMFYLVTVLVILVLLWIGTNASKFKKSTAENFFWGTYHLITSNDQQNLASISNELSENKNIEKIFCGLQAKNNKALRDASQASITLFTDKQFCIYAVTKNPPLLFDIFDYVIKNKVQDEIIKPLLDRLILYSLLYDESIIHREEEFFGIGRFSFIKTLIFGNTWFIRSAYRPLSLTRLSLEMDSVNSSAIKKYFEVFGIAFKALSEGKLLDSLSADILYYEFLRISEIINGFNRQNFHDKKQGKADRIIFECVHGVEDSLRSFVDQKEPLLPEPIPFIYTYENEKEEYCYIYSDKTIYDALACGIFKVLSSLAYDESSYEDFRHFMLHIYMKTYSSIYLDSVIQRLNKLIMQQIDKNLITSITYPSFTAALVYSYSLHDPEDNPFKLDVHRYAMQKLVDNFADLYDKNSKLAMSMLPTNAEYDPKTKVLSYRNGFSLETRDKVLRTLEVE